MMNLRIDIDALGAIRAIETVGLQRTRTAIRRALLESCRLVQREARAHHRFTPRTGALEREIAYQVDRAKLEGTIYFQMQRAPYAPFVHEPTGSFGARGTYVIRPKEKKALRWATFIGGSREISARDYRNMREGKYRRGSEFAYAKEVHHPGSPADRFLYEAADRCHARITAIFDRHIAAATRGAR